MRGLPLAVLMVAVLGTTASVAEDAVPKDGPWEFGFPLGREGSLAEILKAWDSVEKDLPTHRFWRAVEGWEKTRVKVGAITTAEAWEEIWKSGSGAASGEVPKVDFTAWVLLHARPMDEFPGEFGLRFDKAKSEWHVLADGCGCKGGSCMQAGPSLWSPSNPPTRSGTGRR